MSASCWSASCKRSMEVLELYSRLSWEQQSRIFQRGSRQRIVLATNVAETSITVPGIRAVIDSGLARISRYSLRNRLQRCPSSPSRAPAPISARAAAAAWARGCACGCTREEDFEARAPFTEPEILRTNLAALLLRLAADGLGEAEIFPSSIRPIRARSMTAIGCCRNCRRWMPSGASRAAAGPWRACRWIRAWRGRCSRASVSTRRANCWRSSRD